MTHPTIKATPTFNVDIHMAGDIAAAGLFIQRYAVDEGMCVTLMPQSFIYTGGREEGFRVGFINYPRFPTEHLPHIHDAAYRLALALLEELGQHSFSITDPERTVWYSRREPDPAPQTNLDVEAAVKAALKSVIDEHPMGHWNDEQVRTVARRAILAARERAAPSPRVPSGWKLVPIDPTPEMVEAGRIAAMNAQGGYDGPSRWEAMLSAAPTPPENQPEDRQ